MHFFVCNLSIIALEILLLLNDFILKKHSLSFPLISISPNSILQLLGHKLEIESEEGKYTKVIITFAKENYYDVVR